MKFLLSSLVVLGLWCSACGEDPGPTILDTIPPSIISDLGYAVVDSNEVTLSWTAPGDDGNQGQATRYALHVSSEPIYDLTWENAVDVKGLPRPAAQGITESLRVAIEKNSISYFGMKSADEAENWSDLSNVIVVAPGDTLAPNAVSDLAARVVSPTEVALSWTAPGGNGSVGKAQRYDLRFATTRITESSWSSETEVSIPPPGPAGTQEQVTISLPGNDVYFYGLRARDAEENWSGISNQPSTDLALDVTAPATTSDLEVVFATGHTLSVIWTAPGDDGTIGVASEYDLRYLDTAITDETWTMAAPVEGMASPSPSGSRERHTISGLDLDRTYYFALQTRDESGNWSQRSSVAHGNTVTLLRLTNRPGQFSIANQPAWSPDGQLLAFTTYWVGNFEIYTIPAVGGALKRITFNKEPDGTPSFSPDGQLLAFASDRGGIAEIWTIDLSVPSSEPSVLFQSNEDVGRCMWSPDGSRITYSVRTSVSPYTNAIYTASPSGEDRALLVENASINAYPSWSPDGQYIVFGSTRSGDWNIWTVPSRGGEPTQLTHNPTVDAYPTWSPKGDRIAFSSNRTGNYEIWSMTTDGSELEQLTFEIGTSRYPAWSPTGDAIAFSSSRATTVIVSDLYILYLADDLNPASVVPDPFVSRTR